VQKITQEQIIPILGAYIHAIATDGMSIKAQKNLSESTLLGYLNAATAWLQHFLQIPVNTHGNKAQNKGNMHPILYDAIAFRKKWRKPNEKREPYTYRMFNTLAEQVAAEAKHNRLSLLGNKAAVFDWTRLGVFTGSRAAEYAQTTGSATRFSAIPTCVDAGEWASCPLAFMACDFIFYDAHEKQIRHSRLCTKEAYEVHIRFRFDKSPKNFTIRKFKRSGHKFLCPVRAAKSIIMRAAALKIQEKHPLGSYRSTKKFAGYRYLCSSEVITMMRQTCVDAYPDKSSYHRIHIKCIVSHSNRVTAAVALSNSGLSIDEIAYRLRWSPQSVSHYLRECSKALGKYMDAAIHGVHLI
jgi:hypothetical protein